MFFHVSVNIVDSLLKWRLALYGTDGALQVRGVNFIRLLDSKLIDERPHRRTLTDVNWSCRLMKRWRHLIHWRNGDIDGDVSRQLRSAPIYRTYYQLLKYIDLKIIINS